MSKIKALLQIKSSTSRLSLKLQKSIRQNYLHDKDTVLKRYYNGAHHDLRFVEQQG